MQHIFFLMIDTFTGNLNFLSSIFQCVQPFAGDRKQDSRKLDYPNWNLSSLNEANMKCYTKENIALSSKNISWFHVAHSILLCIYFLSRPTAKEKANV